MNRNDKNNDGKVLKISSKIPYDDEQIIRKNENIKFPKIFPSKYEDNNLDNLIKQYKNDLKEGKISVANGNKDVSGRAIEQKNQNKIKNQEISLDKSTAEKSRYEVLDTKPNFGKSIDESIDKISDFRNSKNLQENNQNKKEISDNKNYYHNNEEKDKVKFNKNQNKTSFRGDASDFSKFTSEKTSENLTINQETKPNNKRNEFVDVKNVEQEKSLKDKNTKETLEEIQKIKEEYNALRFAENKNESKKQKREEKYSKKNGKNSESDFKVPKIESPIDENKTENVAGKTDSEKDKIVVPEIQIKTEIVSNEIKNIKETKTDTNILGEENETNVVNSEKKEIQTKNKSNENIKPENVISSKKIEEKKKEKPKVVKQEENKLNKKQKEKEESLKTSKKPTLKVEKIENTEDKKSNNKQVELNKDNNLGTGKLTTLKNKLGKIFKTDLKNKNKVFNLLLIFSCFVFAINIVLVSMLFYNIKTGGKKYLDINYNTINVNGNGISPSAVQSAWQSSVCVGAGGNVIDNDSFYSKTSNRGSGIVLKINESDNSAYILTCEHVIDGYENAIYVLFSTYLKPIKVTLVGVSMRYDIAVLKVKNVSNIDGIKEISSYDSRYLSLGESSFTVGNSLSSGLTVSQGIVSATNKQVSINGVINREIQTDIAINPGNSGGGLFNSAGEFIGLVNAKLSTTNSSGTQTIVEGVSYAIPGTFAISLANSIIRNGGSATYVDFGLTFSHTEKYVSLKLVNDKYIETFEVRISAISSSSCAKNKLKENDIIQSITYTSFSGETKTITMYNEYSYDDICFDIAENSDVIFNIMSPLFSEEKTIIVSASVITRQR